MRTKSILLLPLLFLSAPKILGQSVNSGAAAAPTNFSRSFDLIDETEDLTKSPGTSYRDSWCQDFS